MKRIFAALIFALLACSAASAQGCGPSNPNCIVADRPAGDSTGAAANTRFVTSAIASSGLSVGVSPIVGGTNTRVLFDNNGILGEYTNAQLTALCQGFTSVLPGCVSASGGGTSNFLRADGTWAAPPGGSITIGTTTITSGTTTRLLYDLAGVVQESPVLSLTAGGPLNITSTAASNNQGFAVTQSSPTSGTRAQTIPFGFSSMNFNTQNASSGSGALVDGIPNTWVAGLLLTGTLGGSNFGTPNGAGYSTILATATETVANSTATDVIAIDGQAYSNVTGPAGASIGGILTGGNFQSICFTSCKRDTIEGVEIDIGIFTASSVLNRSGISVWNNGPQQATTIDTAYLATSTTAGGEFKNLMMLSNLAGQKPLSNTGNLFTADTAYTVANIFNFPTMTVTGNILSFPNVVVTGAGHASFPAGLAGVTTNSTASAGDVGETADSITSGAAAATATFTNGSAVIAYAGNTLNAGSIVNFTTTGALPTNFAVNTNYYVIATGLSGSQFEVSATPFGSAIVAGSAGSGTQTVNNLAIQTVSLTPTDVAVVQITAGQWECSGSAIAQGSGNGTAWAFYLSTTSNTFPAVGNRYRVMQFSLTVTSGTMGSSLPPQTFKVSGTTNIFVESDNTFSTGNTNSQGQVHCIRTR